MNPSSRAFHRPKQPRCLLLFLIQSSAAERCLFTATLKRSLNAVLMYSPLVKIHRNIKWSRSNEKFNVMTCLCGRCCGVPLGVSCDGASASTPMLIQRPKNRLLSSAMHRTCTCLGGRTDGRVLACQTEGASLPQYCPAV